MNTQTFIELAKARNAHQHQLNEVYRHEVGLVATDGHRLHISNGLPSSTPHFPSGLDAEFPDYSHIVKASEGANKDAITLSLLPAKRKEVKRFQQQLKTLITLVRRIDASTFAVMLITTRAGKAYLKFQSGELKFFITIPCECDPIKSRRQVNLTYLADAIKLVELGACEVSLPKDPMQVIRFDLVGGTSKTQAYVMPLRMS